MRARVGEKKILRLGNDFVVLTEMSNSKIIKKYNNEAYFTFKSKTRV